LSTARLLVDRRFWPLFWVQFLTAFNDNVLKMGLVLLVTYGEDLFGEPVTVFGLGAGPLNAVGGLLLMLPFLLFSATAGQLADKLPKDWIMRRVKAAEIAIMMVGAAGFWIAAQGSPDTAAPLLLLVVFLAGTQSAVFGPVKYSLIPQVLPKAGEIVAGNALVETGTYISVLMGGAAATALLIAPRLIGASPTAGLNVIAFGLIAFAVAGYLAARAQRPVPAESPDLIVSWEPLSSSWRALRGALADRDRRFAMLANSWFWAVGASVLVVVPTWVERVLRADEATNTLTQVLFSIGIGVGSLLCARWSRGRLEMGMVVVGGIGISVFLLDLFLAGAPWPGETARLTLTDLAQRPMAYRLAFDLFAVAVAGGFFMVPLYSFLQHSGPEGERARIIGALNILNALFIVAVLGIVTVVLAVGIEERLVFLALALLNVGWVIASYRALADRALRLLAETFVRMCWRVRVIGQDNLPTHGPVLIVSNHVSYVDFLMLMTVVHRRHRFVIWHAFTKVPVGGALTRHYDVIPVNSEDRAAMVRTFRQISRALRDGEAVILFPEGGLPYSPGLQPFMRGIEVILKQDPVPVVPIVINGLWGSPYSRKGGRAFKSFRLPWKTVTITIGEPMAADGQTTASIHDRIAAMYALLPDSP
jgi:1-acyl-sn-glycerol-3-phosphate acyltransferase